MSKWVRRVMLVASLLLLAVLVYLSNYINGYSTSETVASDVNERIAVLIIFTNAEKNAQLRDKFKVTVDSMVQRSSLPIDLHIIGDQFSRAYATSNVLDRLDQKMIKVFMHEMQPLAAGVTEIFGDVIRYFRHSATSYYGDNLFFISIVMGELIAFKEIPRIIMLDSDLKFRSDIAKLWRQFDNFSDTAIIGIAHEQQPVYRHVFSSYRSKNKNTKIGEPPPDGLTGFNSGVLLLNLEKMRHSTQYRTMLDADILEVLTARYKFQGHLGDQDFYTLIGMERPELFYVLSCDWNRQLCRYWEDKGYKNVFHLYHDCRLPVNIYHGNCNSPIPDD